MPPKIKIKKASNLLYGNKEDLIKKINDKSIFKEKYKNQPFLFYIAKAGIPAKEKIELYELMKNNGCDFNELDNTGNNIYSCIYDKQSLIYFTENNVSVNVVNNYGKPMTSFLNKRDFYILNEMSKTPDYLINDKQGNNFLFKKGCELYFEFLDLIADKNFQNSFGENVSFFIPTEKELIERLIKIQIDFNCKNNNNETLLYKASVKKIQLLKELDIVVDLQLNQSNNPVEKEIVKLFCFISKGNLYNNENILRNNVLESTNKLITLIDYGIWSHQMTNYYSVILSIKDKTANLLNSKEYKKEEKVAYIENLLINIQNKFDNEKFKPEIIRKRL